MAPSRARPPRRWRLLASLGVLSLAGGCDTSGASASLPREGAARAPATASLHTCAACHGEEGVSRAEIFPNLAGQPKAYLLAQLTAFRDHTRRDRDAKAYMWGFSACLDQGTMGRLAGFYAAQRPALAQRGGEGSPELRAGEALFKAGAPDRGVPPCASCHGERGEGEGETPRLEGQHKDYLRAQLDAFASGARDHPAMSLIAKGMTGAERRAVSAYLSAL